jgi:outer membrane cobalamin receptor
VLETVPGVVISQHSGEGKANQYYVRGFNLDHGTDFATTVAGVPVNMPTHGHGHGYSDLNFLIPELVSGIQFSKGPYFAEQGDFATAGAATINYYASRLPGDPAAGVMDLHLHPTVPRTARVNLVVGF